MENWYHRPQLFILGTRANSWAIQHPENSRCDSQPCVRCRAFSADWNIICLSSPTPMLYCNSCPTVLLWCSEWSERWQQLLGPLWNSWTEPSIRRVSSSRVGLVVGKKPNLWTTHPVADLALKVAGGWWTRFAQIPFGLQLLNAWYFELFYSWLACGMPTSSVHRECFQFRGCDAALSQCGL